MLQLKSDITLHVLKPPQAFSDILLSMQHSYMPFSPRLLEIKEIGLSLSVSNARPERGASTVKRLKSRLRSSLGNDMLASLMHMSINGPELHTIVSVTTSLQKQGRYGMLLRGWMLLSKQRLGIMVLSHNQLWT